MRDVEKVAQDFLKGFNSGLSGEDLRQFSNRSLKEFPPVLDVCCGSRWSHYNEAWWK